jgi:hypothetical protein
MWLNVGFLSIHCPLLLYTRHIVSQFTASGGRRATQAGGRIRWRGNIQTPRGSELVTDRAIVHDLRHLQQYRSRQSKHMLHLASWPFRAQWQASLAQLRGWNRHFLRRRCGWLCIVPKRRRLHGCPVPSKTRRGDEDVCGAVEVMDAKRGCPKVINVRVVVLVRAQKVAQADVKHLDDLPRVRTGHNTGLHNRNDLVGTQPHH